MRDYCVNNKMATGCSMADLTRLLISIMILATQFPILAQATNELVSNISTASGQVQRSSFPKGFVFGSASSAFQIEGAAEEGGRGLSIWDNFEIEKVDIPGNPSPKTAVDQYHRFEEDIQLMKNMGMDAYRFSIAWPRILPNGTGEVNLEGVNYYNVLINALLANGIQPYVTLFHWDLPQALEDSLGGWRNESIVDAYAKFARLSFHLFGDRVKHWITFNEVFQLATQGYFSATMAPGRCTPPKCTVGDASREPFIVTHNCLNAHAEAVRIYRSDFKEYQKGVIGITVDSVWHEPLQENYEDREASHRAMEFNLGWLLDPIFFGDYPTSMWHSVGDRLPQFTTKEKDRIRGSCDFVGFNHYTSKYVTASNDNDETFICNDVTFTPEEENRIRDSCDFVRFKQYRSQHATADDSSASNDNNEPFIRSNVTITHERNGVPIGVKGGSPWLHVVPYGMQKSLAWIRNRYGNPIVYITENGVDEENTDGTQSIFEQLNDQARITYYHDYLEQLLIAIREGSNVLGYFAWSFLDNFEWSSGYALRFGIYYVDYNDDQKRYPKESAKWFKDMLSK